MMTRVTSTQQSIFSYETIEIKLAALLLAEIPDSTFKIEPQSNSIRKKILIFFQKEYSDDVHKLLNDFINRRARVDVFLYNKSLNLLRDKIKELDD